MPLPQVAGAVQRLVSNPEQLAWQKSAPVDPDPMTVSHVSPFRFKPSHFSPALMMPLPQADGAEQ
jgi:hypothetical protein